LEFYVAGVICKLGVAPNAEREQAFGRRSAK
jgi:hypothetical protein